MNKRPLYIAAYHGSDDERPREALLVVRNFATGGQKSLFECFLSAAEKRDLLAWPAWQLMRRELHGQLHALSHQILLQRGVDPEHCETRAMNLPSTFARILLWDFDLPVYRWIEQRVEATGACALPTRAEVVSFFERRSERTGRLAQGLVNRLHRWLVTVFP